MAKEKGLKHKEILKCMRCREDKQKVGPLPFLSLCIVLIVTAVCTIPASLAGDEVQPM